jgi:hypothetical protein
MHSLYPQLIRETLLLLKEEAVRNKEPLLVSPESLSLFALKKEPRAPFTLPSSPLPKSIKKEPTPTPKIREERIAPPSNDQKIPARRPSVDLESEACALIKRFSPHISLNMSIPNDEQAKDRANSWQKPTTAAVALYFGEDAQELHFLKEMAKAIEARWLSCKVSKAQGIRWGLFLSSSTLKWIIASEALLQEAPELRASYRENPATSEKFLGKTSLILIPPPSFYLKNPSAKRSLWKMLSSLLSS